MMRRVLLGLASLFGLLVVAIVLVATLVPIDAYKPEIIAEVKSVTGRELRIDGPIRVSILPSLALELSQVGFAAPLGADMKEMVTLESARLELKLIPLLSGHFEIAAFVLERPVVVLGRDKTGRGNWQFDAAKTEVGKPDKDTGAASAPLQLALSDARIVDGTVIWMDDRSGEKRQMNGVNVQVRLPSLDEPLSIQGELIWRSKEFSIDLGFSSPRALLEDGASQVTARMESDTVKLRFGGEIVVSSSSRVSGDIDLDVASLRGLADWAGTPLAAPEGTLGPLHVQGTLDVAGSKVALRKAQIQLDDAHAAGDLDVDSATQPASIHAKLVVDRVDLDPYLAGAKGGDPVQGEGSASADSRDNKIDLSGLRAIDADLHLSAGSIRAGKVHIADSTVAARLSHGRLIADLSQFSTYEGAGHGKVVVDGSRDERVSLDVELDLSGVNMDSLMRDAVNYDRLSGTGTIVASVAAEGTSQRQLVDSLRGKGKLDIHDGAIKGIDLVALVLHAASASKVGDPSAKTEFSEMRGTFTIANGILRNNDLSLKSPLLQVTGAGTVDLGQSLVDYKVTPKVVTPLVGELGLGTPGVMVPVFIRGKFGKLRFEPDLAGLIRQGFTAPVDIVEGVVKIPGALLGGRKAAPPADAPKKESHKDNALGAFKGLFGR